MEIAYSLVSSFTEEEIETIYNYLVEFSIRNYEEKLKIYKDAHFQNQYRSALLLKKELIKKGIDLTELDAKKIETYLSKKQKKYNDNLHENRFVTIEATEYALHLFKSGLSKNAKSIEKANYLFDIVTSIITPANNYIKYCLHLPQTGTFEFDFKDNLPIDHETNIETLLIQRQGTADDVANLILFLGRQLNLPITKEFIIKNEKRYPINKLRLGKTFTYIDAFSKITGEKSKSECFLRSAEGLSNSKIKYQEIEKDKTQNITETNSIYHYDLNIILNKLNLILPEVKQKEKTKIKQLLKQLNDEEM